MTDAIDNALIRLATETIKVQVNIDQVVPLDLSLKLKDIIDVNQLIPDKIQVKDTLSFKYNLPLNLNLPINQTIPLAFNIPLDQTIAVDKSSLGIDPDMPLNFKHDLPINLTLPISIDPLDLNANQQFMTIHQIANLLRVSVLIPPKELVLP